MAGREQAGVGAGAWMMRCSKTEQHRGQSEMAGADDVGVGTAAALGHFHNKDQGSLIVSSALPSLSEPHAAGQCRSRQQYRNVACAWQQQAGEYSPSCLAVHTSVDPLLATATPAALGLTSQLPAPVPWPRALPKRTRKIPSGCPGPPVRLPAPVQNGKSPKAPSATRRTFPS